MPQICLEIPEVSDCISRPIASDVIRDLCERIGISKNTSLRYKGSGMALPVPGSTMDDRDALNRLPGDSRITIDVVEDYNEDFAMTTAIKRPENICFFIDEKLGIYLKPVYQRITAECSITLTAPDETTADTWYRTMKRRATQGVAENVHLVNYHYPVHTTFLVLLLELHKLREARGGYNEDFGTYLKNHFTPKMTVIRDQAYKNPTFVIKEKQQAVLGWFDFPSNPPKYEKQDDSGSWSISFTYTYVFDSPQTAVMIYPLMVHNQLLSSAFYPDIKPAELEDYVTQPSLSSLIHRNFTYETRYAHAWRAKPGIPIPYFDDWLPEFEYDNHQNLLRIMLQRDENNPHALLSLTNMGYVSLPSWLLPYLRKDPVSITIPNENVINVSLYKGKTLMDPSKIIVSPDLDLHYAEPLDVRESYHLTVSLNKRIFNLSPKALKTLSEFGEAAIRIIITLDPTIITQEFIAGLNPVTANIIKNILMERNDRIRPILNSKQQEKDLTRIQLFIKQTLIPQGANVQSNVSLNNTPLLSTPETIHAIGGYNSTLLRKPNQVYIPNIRPSGIVPYGELKNIIVIMDKKQYFKTASELVPLYNWNLVGTFTIIAERS